MSNLFGKGLVIEIIEINGLNVYLGQKHFLIVFLSCPSI